MGSFRLRQGPQQRRLAGISLRSTLVGLVLGVGLIAAAPASAAADLSATKSASPEPVVTGRQLTYTIVVHNAGPDPATGATLQDELPLGLSLVSATSTAGTCSSTSPVMCDLGTVTPTTDVTVTIVTSVGPGAPSHVTNTASVSSPDDTNPANDDSNDVVTTVVPAADLALTGSAVPDTVTAGELLTYTFTVQNNGPSTATGAQITDALPTGMRFEQATNGCAESSGTVTCDVGTLASGDKRDVQITVTPQQAGTFTNEAQASSAVQDPDSSNDKADIVTTVNPVPGPGNTSTPQSGPLNVVITGSYVLISGRSVKLVKGRFVPVSLTCAGPRPCSGTMTVSTSKPVKRASNARKKRKRKPRLVRLGSKQFAIGSNRREKVLVPVSKSKVKLLRRLRRVKAKATIREIDVRGNPRISIRMFTLRAR
jgi:uncharacterized repeat protein (TIGR01451 family)